MCITKAWIKMMVQMDNIHSRNGRDSSRIWPYVPVMSRLHKNGCDSSSIPVRFGPYISIFSGRVIAGMWAWPQSGCGPIFFACVIYKVRRGSDSDSGAIVTNCISNGRFSYDKGGSQTFAIA